MAWPHGGASLAAPRAIGASSDRPPVATATPTLAAPRTAPFTSTRACGSCSGPLTRASLAIGAELRPSPFFTVGSNSSLSVWSTRLMSPLATDGDLARFQRDRAVDGGHALAQRQAGDRALHHQPAIGGSLRQRQAEYRADDVAVERRRGVAGERGVGHRDQHVAVRAGGEAARRPPGQGQVGDELRPSAAHPLSARCRVERFSDIKRASTESSIFGWRTRGEGDGRRPRTWPPATLNCRSSSIRRSGVDVSRTFRPTAAGCRAGSAAGSPGRASDRSAAGR